MTMKTFILAFVAVTAAAAFSAPETDPNPYADYEAAMTSPADNPFAAVWQNDNKAYLAYHLSDAEVSRFAADEASARGLLAAVKDNWETDALKAEQIAAVSQWVMTSEPPWYDFWSPSPAAGRKIWTAALLETARTTKTTYVKMFCLDQLRWCGYGCPGFVGRVREIGNGADRSVVEFAACVARELEDKGIGR